MKLWVDDLRLPPEGWHWAKTSGEAICILSEWEVEQMSLDHDLGGEDTTRFVVRWLETDRGHICWPDRVEVHTANPVGREYLEAAIARHQKSSSVE